LTKKKSNIYILKRFFIFTTKQHSCHGFYSSRKMVEIIVDNLIRGDFEQPQHEEKKQVQIKSKKRFTLLPIVHDDLWKAYKNAQASIWTAEEMDLSDDYKDWVKLTKDEQHFLSHILAFFSGSDGIVLENLATRFINDVDIPEARAFYAYQMANEMERRFIFHPSARANLTKFM